MSYLILSCFRIVLYASAASISLASLKMNTTHEFVLLISVTPSGQFVGQVQNPAVCEKLLTEISQWLCQDIEWSDIISRLRPRTVPNGYTYKPWRSGKCVRTSCIPLYILYAVL